MTVFKPFSATAGFFACVIAVSATISSAQAQSAGVPDPTDSGKAVFKRANCMGCHKWHGNGGGGYGGDALSLRKTELTREQIIETVTCGRPGTGMPFFVRGAYDTIKCYGVARQDIGDQMPPESTGFLRSSEIEAVADYIIAHIKGRSDPTFSECINFFSEGSRVCNVFKTQPTTESGNTKKGHE